MANGFVLDSSVSLSWCFKDEETPESLSVLQLAGQWAPVVPMLWHIEMANILGMALKTGRMSFAEMDTVLARIEALEIETATDLVPLRSRRVLDLMTLSGLTAYDACYLELAISLGLPLATFDRKLNLAAQAAGVPLVTAPVK